MAILRSRGRGTAGRCRSAQAGRVGRGLDGELAGKTGSARAVKKNEGELLASGLVDGPLEGRGLDVRANLLNEVVRSVVKTDVEGRCWSYDIVCQLAFKFNTENRDAPVPPVQETW